MVLNFDVQQRFTFYMFRTLRLLCEGNAFCSSFCHLLTGPPHRRQHRAGVGLGRGLVEYTALGVVFTKADAMCEYVTILAKTTEEAEVKNSQTHGAAWMRYAEVTPMVPKNLLLWKGSPRYQRFCNLTCLTENRACLWGRPPKVAAKSLCWQRGYFVSRHHRGRYLRKGDDSMQCTKLCRVTRSNQWRPNDRRIRWFRRRRPKILHQLFWLSDVGAFVLASKMFVPCWPGFDS